MDGIAVLDAGRILELGTHDELRLKNGLYARLWARQSGGFLGS
jgi:ABC-type multidrug transport system fused ATPase/permease subunit